MRDFCGQVLYVEGTILFNELEHFSSGLVLFSFMASIFSGFGQMAVVERPETASTNSFYVGNRPPLEASPFYKLPIGSITPRGWLRHQLELERDGMTGHLEEISPWLNFAKSSWADPQGRGNYGWEELPYWLKGYGDLGYVLKDPDDHRGGEKMDRRGHGHAAGGRLVRPARTSSPAWRASPISGRTCSCSIFYSPITR